MRRCSAILLAAGYGTRLYPLTKDRPKALLPLGEGVLLDQAWAALRRLPAIARCVLVTNHRFAPQFEQWRRHQEAEVEIVDDGTTGPTRRLGAIPDLLLGWKRAPHDDVLVIGTDNVFTWSLTPFLRVAQAKRPSATIGTGRVPTLRDASLYGVVATDQRGRITQFLEKPAQAPSKAIALCIYYFPATMKARMVQFLRQNGNGDAPGFFLSWLVQQEPVYAHVARGQWFDIGSHASYEAVVAWKQRRSR